VIHLHIGRHKTGTSALQQLLRRNRTALGEHGFVYLSQVSGGTGNHDLANALNPAWIAKADADQRARAERELEVSGRRLRHRGEKIVSSEAFQGTPPAAAAAFFPAGRTRVIVYVREQLDYLLSAYAQYIQAQTVRMPFIDYAARLRTFHDLFLDGWAEAFGGDALTPRLYARDHLKDGDIRHDFLALVGVDPAWLAFGSGVVNPTIGPELIEAKAVINAFVPHAAQEEAGLFNLMSALALEEPARLGVSPAFAARLRARFVDSNRRLFETHMAGIAEGFPMRDFAPASAPIAPAEALERTLARIEALAPPSAEILRRHLPGRDEIAACRPMLPQDWAQAEAALDRGQPA
jgi:hypothetical protein